MNRRTFLAGAASLMALPLNAEASTFIEYKPGVIQAALDAGKTVFVDYSATWCGTCRRQKRVVNDLRANDASYDRAMVFVNVDWDTYRKHEITKSRNIPRRSTLLVLRGRNELGRVVAGTSKRQIKALMDKGL